MTAIATREATFTSRGSRLLHRSWRPAGPVERVMVLVHGFGEHSGRYDRVAQLLAADGTAVHAYDLRGHGRSEGPRAIVRSHREHLDDLALLLERAREEHRGTPVFLMGHSMGGLIAALFVVTRRARIAGCVLSAPALGPFGGLERLAAGLGGLVARWAPRLPTKQISLDGLSRDPAVAAAYRADPLVFQGRVPLATAVATVRGVRATVRLAPRLTVPLLALHGAADPITPAAGAAWFCEHTSSTDRTFRLLPGLRHEILNEPGHEGVAAEIANWMVARTSRPVLPY